jgi:release factor glutamine methyltransferase
MSLRAAARELAAEFRAAGLEDAELEAEVLARHVAGVSRAAYFTGTPLEPAMRDRLTALAAARLRREPSAYLVGEREFYGRVFRVGPGVLVPRPETELLVELGLSELRRDPRAVVVDVGTGSGCVAVSIAAETGAATVAATDVSGEALSYAVANARRHAPATEFVRGYLTNAIGRADVVLANLPYIPSGEIDALEPEVSIYEPRVALDGGPDGLDLVRELATDCARRLRPRLLAVELAYGQAAAIAAEFRTIAPRVDILRDLGGIDRVVVARWR